jgi:hypothetical protein
MDSDESGRNAERVAEFVIAKAMSGHFAYFKLVINLETGVLTFPDIFVAMNI